MYYNRILSSEEALYVSRAQQKIAELAAATAEESDRNDLDDYKVELMVELEYSINVLKSTFLDWTPDDIRMMMDYYALRGGLTIYPFRSISFVPTHSVSSGYVWATVPQLNAAIAASEAYDQYLLSLILAETTTREDQYTYLVSLISGSTSGSTLSEITAGVTIGGIRVGDVFPIGTTIESIITKLLSTPASVSGLTIDSYVPIIEAGSTLSVALFTWTVDGGAPTNLKLNDSLGNIVDVSVSGASHALAVEYTSSLVETITWTLSGDNIDPIVLSVDRVYGSYYGKEPTVDDTPVVMTDTKVLLGAKTLTKTSESITLLADTTSTEQGFIAVPKAQTISSYTKWEVDETNKSDILVGEFILPPVDLDVNGVIYEVYRWGYRSPLTNNLKLYR